MTKLKNYGLYVKLNDINTYDELILFISSFKTLKGLSVKYLAYLSETKSFIKVFVDDGFTLKDIKYALVHKTYPKHIFCPICKKVELHSNGRDYPKTCGSKKCHYELMELTLKRHALKNMELQVY